MAHENRFITSGGTNIWFAAGGSAPNVEWNGTSPVTPWTSQSTTPFAIAMNDVTGQRWTPTEAAPTDVYAGRMPVPRTIQSYPNVQDQIPIQIRGTTQDAMIAALRLLKHELRSISFNAPALFVFKPDGQTNAGYTEVYSADVGVHPFFINDENGRRVLRAVLTIMRAPFFSNLASGVSALSSGTHTNQAGSNTRNLPSTLNGDVGYEGAPLNIRFAGVNNATSKYMRTFMCASIAAAVSSTENAGVRSGANAIAANCAITFISITHAALYTAFAGNERLRLRILMRFSSVTANTVVQVSVPSMGFSRRITLAAHDRVVDFGDFLADILRTRTDDTVVSFWLISGGPVTLVNTELLAYYDFATIPFPLAALFDASNIGTTIDSVAFREYSGRATIPYAAPIANGDSSSFVSDFSARPYYGTLPRAYPGAKLWLAFTTVNASDVASTAFTEQITTTATYAPLFLSFRGAQ